MTLPSVYSGGIFHKRKEAEKTLKKMVDEAKFARKLGSFLLNVNPATIGRPKTNRELKVQAEFLNRLGVSPKLPLEAPPLAGGEESGVQRALTSWTRVFP